MQYLQKQFTEINWLIFYFIIVVSWVFVFFMILASDSTEGIDNFYGSDFLATLCQPIYKISDWPYAFLMWSIMGIAMMVPTIQPTLKTYDDLSELNNASNLGFLSILTGFIVIWVIFSVVASLIQIYFTQISLIRADGIFISFIPSVTLLILTALYQFSNLKKACLHRCRHPLLFFLNDWNGSFKASFFIGLKVGVYCLGCCWLLMMLAFVGGVMNLGFMALATLVMIAEKLPDYGRYVTLPLSVLLLISGSIVVISNLI
tara:strand:- start:133 stop:912 length:780 start_codon:yes stop_codon:yes gene_type:complete